MLLDHRVVDREGGLAGQTFFVDYDGDGVLDAGEPSGVSDATGAYVIEDVAPGNWPLRELGDPSFVCSFPATCSYGLTLGSGDVQTGFDFANWTGISKTGTKFEDLDADGSDREVGEPGPGPGPGPDIGDGAPPGSPQLRTGAARSRPHPGRRRAQSSGS